MSDRDGIFAGDDPFVLARTWLDEARATEPNDPDAAALATVDADGMPDVRVVLMRHIESHGAGDGAFVFFTNYDSAKGRQIETTGKAAFVIHWKSLRRQIRVRGTVTRENGPQADAYYNGRALQSRIGAWASRQSQPLTDRQQLLDEVAAATTRLGDAPPRPPHWGGFRIAPEQIEFWADGAFRLHDRFRWTRSATTAGGWSVTRLSP